MPQDRIVPFLGGGPLLRSSTLLAGYGVVVALGGAPIELVVATDMSLQFLQVTDPGPKMESPYFLFRVYEKVALRIKERNAIVGLVPPKVAHGRHGWHRRHGRHGCTGATGGTGGAAAGAIGPEARGVYAIVRNRERGPSK